MNKAIGFIGLGIMGFPMAGHLSKEHNVFVCNRSKEKTKNWIKKHSGTECCSIKEISELSDILFLCVGNDDDVREVILHEDGAIHGLGKSAIIVDHTTASARLAVEVYDEARKHEINFLDAPLSGGQAGAESGQLTIMVGGDKEIFDKVLPVMDCYAKACTLIGEAGSGQKAKMVNQICIASLIQGLSEALHFAKRENLDIAAVMGAISKGAAQSWQMENRWQTMIDDKFDFGFAVEWMRKDLEIAIDEAKRVNANLEVTELINEFYKDIEKIGGKRFDTSSLIKRLEP